ncbi:RloB-like protein [Methylacidiphilum kamchatkense Kam1]|uniref:RloB-like protein n=1 Tax=Methylacidiphilum kamchatkense Kam1 TaxID=1202785 RepID=A0A516TPJ4_9BACT|nr:RloB-like protein [Methylacidiphilum kamchatkense Kam1]
MAIGTVPMVLSQTLDEEMRSPFYRAKKKNIFVACEGKSEQGYVALLNELAKEQNPPLSVVLRPFCLGGGGPSSMVKEAINKARKESYKEKVILIDDDVCSANPDECQKAEEKAEENGFSIIWQKPNHEGFLLMHLLNEQEYPSLTANNVQAMLQREWPEYEKPQTKDDLRRRIGSKEVERAARRIPQLKKLLQMMGWSLR